MRLLISYILICVIANSSIAQLWDFPPKPFIYSDSDSLMAKYNISSVTSWNHEIVNGTETGKRDLLRIKSYDKMGNLIEEITGSGDTILYDIYLKGYWALKIMNQEIFHQHVEFDSSGKVVGLTVNDYEINIKYDEFNRPLIATNSKGKQIWEYNGARLRKYFLYEDTTLVHARNYYYIEEGNKVAYSTLYFSPEGNIYPNKDSVIAEMDSLERPSRVVSYSISQNKIDSTVVTFDRNNNTSTVNASYGCTKQSITVDSKGLRLAMHQTDCSGILIRKIIYEYVIFN